MIVRSRALTGSRMEPNVSLVQPALTDEQWLLIADLFAEPKPDPRGGRPRLIAVLLGMEAKHWDFARLR